MSGCSKSSGESGIKTSDSSITSQSEPLQLRNLRLTVSENDLSRSKEFEFFPGGHFGPKTQYNGRVPDEFGGAYAVHCRSGKPFSIEVKYAEPGIPRDSALSIMQRMLPSDSGKVVEHDNDDLRKMDCRQPAEFFYYKGGARSELLYATNSNKSVVQINLWTKEG